MAATVGGIAPSNGIPSTWRSPPATPSCAPDEVHIWRSTAGDGGASGGVLLDVLGRYLSRPVGVADIDRTCRHCGHPEHGRPRLAGDDTRGLEFSVSRAGALVLVGVTTGTVVGVDVEALDRAGDWQLVAQQFFSTAERAQLEGIAVERRAAGFLLMWTVKEACLKGDGRGLVADLGAVEVRLQDGQAGRAPTVVSDPLWHVSTFAPTPGHIAAIASARAVRQVLGFDWRGPNEPEGDDLLQQ